MPTDLDKVIAKLSDKRVQSRLRAATLAALKKEGIELSPAEWGELFARMIAASEGRIRPDSWTDYIGPVLGGLGSILSDRRLKTNIVARETRPDGLRLYEFSFKGFATRWRGVIAQDVLQTHPEAVDEDETGYLTVNYNMLGVTLQSL